MNSPAVRAVVEELLLDYVACLDDGRFEEWPDHFTERCRYQIISRSSQRRGLPSGFYLCDSRNMLHDRVLALRHTSVSVPQTYRHILNGTRIISVEGDVCHAKTNYLVVRTIQGGEMTLFASGEYVDTVVFADGGAKFSEKVVITDSDAFDMYLLAPL